MSAALLVAAAAAVLVVMPGARAVKVDEAAVLEKMKLSVGDYNLNWQSTKYAPVTTPTTDDAKADCGKVFKQRKKLYNPTHIKFTLDDKKVYTKLQTLAETIHAKTGGGALRAPMFTMAWGGTHHLIKPLAHNFGGAENAPFASDDADSVMPRTYDPRFTGRHLVAVVPHGDFAAFKAALYKQDGLAAEKGPADTTKIHLVGVQPLQDNGDAMLAADEAVFWSFGWMRHATVSLMQALHAERAGVNRAWFIDSNVIAMVTNKGLLGKPAHFDELEAGDHWDAAAWANGAISDYERAKQSPAKIWERALPGGGLANVDLNAAEDVIRKHDHGAENQVKAKKKAKKDGVIFMEQALYVNLEKLGTFSFPSAFVRSKEDLSLYTYLTQRNYVKHAADRHVEKVHWAKVHGLQVVKTAAPAPRVIPPARGGANEVIDGITRAHNEFYSDARLDLDNNYHDCSMAEFVRDRVRGACEGEDPLDTASKIVEIAMNYCLEHAYSELGTVDDLDIDHFFRAATTFAVARA